MEATDLTHRRAATIRALFEEHMGIRAPTLQKAVARAGRRLPRTLREKASMLVEAEARAENPKLLRQLDSRALNVAYLDLSNHLKAFDFKAQRRTRLLNMLAGVAFNLMLVLAAFLTWVWWRSQL